MTGILKAVRALFFDESEDETAPQRNGAQPDRGTILVIDDDKVYLDTMRGLLRAEGFNVLTSHTGPKGLDMLRYASDVRVVLLDYNMPTFDGAQTLAYLRKLSPNVKIVALTGVDINLLPEPFREGVDMFLQKPFRTVQLLEVLDNLTKKTSAAGSKRSH